MSNDPSDEFVVVELNDNTLAQSKLGEYSNPYTGKTVYFKLTQGTTFVYTKDSTITNQKITNALTYIISRPILPTDTV